ncbi:MAG: biopolymer transporter ExbD [Rickettsiales bacterium]|nr:biopolymer transporter ExbD [Rickettsiales bacterium]
MITLTKRRKRNNINAINVTPLVDVMLVLLIIFMITSPMLVSGINVNLPKAESAAVQGQDDPISITVTKQGIIYINNSAIDRQTLIAKLKLISQEKYNSRIFIRGDKNTPYEQIVLVVNSISKAGFSKVALLTEID